MGKGDQRTKRGKIYRGTFGKRRARKRKRAINLDEKKSSETTKELSDKKPRKTKTDKAKK